MFTRRTFLTTAVLSSAIPREGAPAIPAASLDPRGQIHIPIGIANTLDTLKTFVEAEGNFSPGFGSFGVYFWIYDRQSGRSFAPTMDNVPCRHGLKVGGLLIPWIEWDAGHLAVRLEVCHVQIPADDSNAHVAATRLRVRNRGSNTSRFMFYAAVRPLGPAGYRIDGMEAAGLDTILARGTVAILAARPATYLGVIGEDSVGQLALSGQRPSGTRAISSSGDCSGALVYEEELEPAGSAQYEFVCPVLPGRRASRHRWADLGQEAMVDVAPLDDKDGALQPYPRLDYYRKLDVTALFRQAETYWRELTGRFEISVPDQRWNDASRAILSHAALCMNEGAPDVAVINYNVFNRDGSYVANIFQKSGLFTLAQAALDYFLKNPFNGRAYPEADNPGQILWALGQQWLFARDREWLSRIYPSAAKIASMIEYYRTSPGPHWVNAKSLEFGDALPPNERAELKPGRCDGLHPEYTEAFDIAGLRSATRLAHDAGKSEDASRWGALSERLLVGYRERFGATLANDYGSYSVLWPCALFPYSSGEAQSAFGSIGPRKPESWRYFPLATAHQGLLAGNREAGYGTLALHLDHEQMRGWFAFDEGGGSDSGGWQRARTTWPHSKEKPGNNLSVAMPHGWAIAEFWLLMRDCLVYEDGDRLVLLAGIAPQWFRDSGGIRVSNLPTHFGAFSLDYKPGDSSAGLALTGAAQPPAGYELRLPPGLEVSVKADGQDIRMGARQIWALPAGTRNVTILFQS
jgi:hypothetical protein